LEDVQAAKRKLWAFDGPRREEAIDRGSGKKTEDGRRSHFQTAILTPFSDRRWHLSYYLPKSLLPPKRLKQFCDNKTLLKNPLPFTRIQTDSAEKALFSLFVNS